MMRSTLPTRDVSGRLTDCYSERVETAAELSSRVNRRSLRGPGGAKSQELATINGEVGSWAQN